MGVAFCGSEVIVDGFGDAVELVVTVDVAVVVLLVGSTSIGTDSCFPATEVVVAGAVEGFVVALFTLFVLVVVVAVALVEVLGVVAMVPEVMAFLLVCSFSIHVGLRGL